MNRLERDGRPGWRRPGTMAIEWPLKQETPAEPQAQAAAREY